MRYTNGVKEFDAFQFRMGNSEKILKALDDVNARLVEDGSKILFIGVDGSEKYLNMGEWIAIYDDEAYSFSDDVFRKYFSPVVTVIDFDVERRFPANRIFAETMRETAKLLRESEVDAGRIQQDIYILLDAVDEVIERGKR
jgi:hypothetical protein